MKIPFRDIIYWGALLSFCTLMVVSFVIFLWILDIDQPVTRIADATIVSVQQDNHQNIFEMAGEDDEFSRVLLPLGPDDGRLPGLASLWLQFKRASRTGRETPQGDGFHGLQAVENVMDFATGSVAEVFLSGRPRQVFRRGHFLYLLTGEQKVQVIDCRNPSQPVLSGPLPYSNVKQMTMQGNIAYLLLERRTGSAGRLLVVDLGSFGKWRELAHIDLPQNAFSFYFFDSRLLVYSNAEGAETLSRLYVYDVDGSFQLRLRGKVDNLSLGMNSLQYDEFLLVPGGHKDLSVYDFSDPLKPVLAAVVQSLHLTHLARYGDFVFASGAHGRLSVVDLSDPLRPVLVTRTGTAKVPAYLLAYGKYTYYFTFDGYLQVFDLPLGPAPKNTPSLLASDGQLISLSPGAGFTLFGKTPVSVPVGVTASLPLPGGAAIIDQLVWQDSLVALGADGMVRFFSLGEESTLVFRQELQLSNPGRWLAAGHGRLYVGGGKGLDIIAQSAEDAFSIVGEMKLSGSEAWDGLVLQDVLLLAAGAKGVLSFSLQNPDSPVATSVWGPPRHLRSQVDVRHLAAIDDDRALLSGGAAGAFAGRVDRDKKFTLQGAFRFSSPVDGVAVSAGIGLVSAGENVCFIDLRDALSMQNLGQITFPNVERFALAPPDFWAGYVDSVGWSVLPLPRFVSPDATGLSPVGSPGSKFSADQLRYRLHLFSDHEVRVAPGVLALPVDLPGQAFGGSSHVL